MRACVFCYIIHCSVDFPASSVLILLDFLPNHNSKERLEAEPRPELMVTCLTAEVFKPDRQHCVCMLASVKRARLSNRRRELSYVTCSHRRKKRGALMSDLQLQLFMMRVRSWVASMGAVNTATWWLKAGLLTSDKNGCLASCGIFDLERCMSRDSAPGLEKNGLLGWLYIYFIGEKDIISQNVSM